MPIDASKVPYCGTPPQPGALWTQWNLDPVLMAALLLVLAVYLRAAGGCVSSSNGSVTGSIERNCFVAGWTVLALAWISPLCNLTVALFSARVGQHMLVVLVAAPLLVLGRPFEILVRAWPVPMRAVAPALAQLARAPLAAALFALLLWLWHLPRPYRATFESDLLYWTMHLTLLASALCLWHVLICRERRELQRAVVAGIVTVVQMGLLGAAITLAPRLLYDPHVLTTQLWGLTPLEDQQLGGLIMWVPGCAIVILAALAAVGRTLLSPASSVQR